MNNFENADYLVLSGGGINGLCQIGALRMLHHYLGKDTLMSGFRGCAGTSVGSLVGLALVCERSLLWLASMCQKLQPAMRTFGSNIEEMWARKSLKQDHAPLDYVVATILEGFIGSANVTFRQLHRVTNKHFAVFVVDINALELLQLDHVRTPNMEVMTAVLASMSIPGIFPPVPHGEQLLVDGALLLNCPVQAFPGAKLLVILLQPSLSPHGGGRTLHASGFQMFLLSRRYRAEGFRQP